MDDPPHPSRQRTLRILATGLFGALGAIAAWLVVTAFPESMGPLWSGVIAGALIGAFCALMSFRYE